MTILDEPVPLPKPAGWVCPHCHNSIHHDQADQHLKSCPATPPAPEPTGRERTLDQLRTAEHDFARRHPHLFPPPPPKGPQP